MEGTHGQLGTGLTNRLSRNNTNSLANVHQNVRSHRTAVAQCTHTNSGLTGQNRTDTNFLHACLEELLNELIRDIGTSGSQNITRLILHIHREGTTVNRSLNVRVQVAVGVNQREHQTAAGATVMLTHDNVLRHIHQTTGQVTRVSGTQCGISQTLTCTVGCDEVLQNRQALTVGGLNRARHNLTLRVRHQTTDTRNLTDLHPVTTCTRGHHTVNGVQTTVRAQVLTHSLCNHVGSLGPNLNQLLTTLFVIDGTNLEVVLNCSSLLLVALHNCRLLRGSSNIGNSHGHARTGCPVETRVLQVIQGTSHNIHRVTLSQIVNQATQTLLVCHTGEPGVVLRQSLVEQDLANGAVQQHGVAGLVALGSFPTFGSNELVAVQQDLHLGVQLNLVTIHRHQSLRNR